MKTIISMLAFFMFAGTLAAADLDKSSFNLVGVNKTNFLLIETPIEIKKEEPKSTKFTIEPRPKSVEPAKTENRIYQDSTGMWRGKADDGLIDWYWSPQNGGFWYRPSAASNAVIPFCPNCNKR
jgi:hypothetical protein